MIWYWETTLVIKNILNSIKLKKIDNIYYLSDPDRFVKQEELYLEVRKKEKRLYSKEEIEQFPLVKKDHRMFQEWKLRTLTINKFIQYIETKTINTVLDLGCGNGWASNFISKKLNCNILALDVNYH